MMFSSARTRPRQGLTLTEMAIVLGVAGMILTGVWNAAHSVAEQQKTTKATEEVAQIVGNYRQMYTAKGIDDAMNAQGWADVTCKGVSAGYFPPDMLPTVACNPTNHNTYPKGPWSGSLTFAQAMTQYNSIVITYQNIPRTACISIASALFTGANKQTFQKIANFDWSVSNVRLLPPYGTAAPWTPNDINGFCSNSPSYSIQVAYAVQ